MCGEGQSSLGLSEVGSGGGREGTGYICNSVNNEKVVLLKKMKIKHFFLTSEASSCWI